jgi:hypothetical protein
VVDPALAQRVAEVLGGVEDAARSAGRDPGSVEVIAVTKFHPASLVRDLAELGLHDVGESRHQEALSKHAELADLALRWHFIGQLQSKKARSAREYTDVLHSLDRRSLLTALQPPGRDLDVFIQVNLTEDPARGGVSAPDLAPFVDDVLATEGLRLRGLMAVAALGAEPARQFAEVRELRDRVVLAAAPDAVELSMGMSGDWREAVAEGATRLRIGTAITGLRPSAA